jgi:uncharacterized membrane protein
MRSSAILLFISLFAVITRSATHGSDATQDGQPFSFATFILPLVCIVTGISSLVGVFVTWRRYMTYTGANHIATT